MDASPDSSVLVIRGAPGKHVLLVLALGGSVLALLMAPLAALGGWLAGRRRASESVNEISAIGEKHESR